MSIISRPGSPVWNCDFWINDQRVRKPTPYGLDLTASGVIFKGKNFKFAQDWEAKLKVDIRLTGGEVLKEKKEAPEPTIREMFDGYLEANGDDLTNRQNIETFLNMMHDHFAEAGIKHLGEITDSAVSNLIAWRRKHRRWGRPHERQISNTSVNRSTIDTLHPVFTWAHDKKGMRFLTEPNWKMHTLKEPESRPRELRATEETALINEFDPEYNVWREFALASGLRFNNTLLRWSEYDADRGVARLIGKGDKVLEIVLSPKAMELIESRRGHHPVFVFTFVAKKTVRFRRNGKLYHYVTGTRYPITYWGGQTYWKRCRAKAAENCPSLLSDDNRLSFRFHDHRHTVGTRLYREFEDLKLVKDALGHANISTSEKYAHVTEDEHRKKLARMENKYSRKAVNE